MKYTVEYAPPAEDELVALWTNASDKRLVKATVNRLELPMSPDPKQVGESRGSPLTRIVLSSPLGLWFDIIEDDRKVLVLSVWEIPTG